MRGISSPVNVQSFAVLDLQARTSVETFHENALPRSAYTRIGGLVIVARNCPAEEY